MGNGDNFALDWIKGELESTLDQARAALESYAEGGREETRLRSCLTSLHQVHGTLRMLEMEGVVLLADHMEQTAQALLNGSIQDSLAAEQTLMQSILQLPAFIEEVQNGMAEDLPLVMPSVNELRVCCDLSPMEFTPPVVPEFSGDQAAAAMQRFRSINGADKVTRVRAAYQQVLLSVLKGSTTAQTVQTLSKIAVGLQRICEGAPLASLWKALEHFAKGYESEPQKMSSEAIRDLRRVDAEMKRLATDGAEVLVEPLSVELVSDLLRVAEGHGEHNDEISELRSELQLPQTPLAKPREALEQANQVLAEEVAAVRDRFDLFTRGQDRSIAQLRELTAPLDTICLTLSMLGDEDGATLLREERAKALAGDPGDEAAEELILSLASALVRTEQALAGGEEVSSDHTALANAAFNEAQMAVLQEARAGIDQIKQSVVDFVSSKWNTDYLDDAPNTLAAVRGALTMIPLTRAAELLTSCSDYIRDHLLVGHRPDWQELDAFADALGGIDYFLERLFETGRVPGDKALDLTEQSLTKLMTATSSAAQQLDPPAAAEEPPLSSSGGDAALSAMLGASPEELAFAADDELTIDDELPSAGAEPKPESGAESQPEAEPSLSSRLELELVDLDSEGEEDEEPAEEPAAEFALEPLEDSAAEVLAETSSAAEPVDAVADFELESDSDTPENSEAKSTQSEDSESIDTETSALVDTNWTESDTGEVGSSYGAVDGAADTSDAQTPGSAAVVGGALAAAATLGVAATAGDSDNSDSDSAVADDPASTESFDESSVVIDEEILEIFVEEVDEVLEAIEAQLPNWSQDLSAKTPVTEIRRNFHTLKGSGRIVGANQIGELGWALENMLNRVLDSTIEATEDHLFLVGSACQLIPDLRADFAADKIIERAELHELLEQIDVVASGGALSKQLAATKSELQSEQQPDEQQPELQEEDFPIYDDGERASDELGALDTRPPAVDVPSFFDDSDTESEVGALDNQVLFAQEVQEHVEALGESVRTSLGDDQLTLNAAFTRALHTIAGSAATAGEEAIVGVAEPLQDVCSVVLRERGGVLEGEYLAFVREGVYALQGLLDIDAIADRQQADADTSMFAAEAERLLAAVFADAASASSADRPVSLLELPDTTILLDAREYLDHWRFGTIDIDRAEQMDNALKLVVEYAHSEEFAEIGNVLRRAHVQFADAPLDEERHTALVTVHDDLLVQLDALAANQVTQTSPEVLNRLVDLLGEISNSQVADEPPEEDEPLSDDAQEALAYELDDSSAFDIDALDDDVFGVEDASAEPEPQVAPAEQTDLEQTQVEQMGGEATELRAAFSSASAPATGSEDDEVDYELLAIFFEEADEILEAFDQSMQGWEADRSNQDCLDNMLRGLHTLKGGARLAGLSVLGDMTHEYESELIVLQEASSEVTAQQFVTLQSRYDDLVDAVSRARSTDGQEQSAVDGMPMVQDDAAAPEVLLSQPATESGEHDPTASAEVVAADVQDPAELTTDTQSLRESFESSETPEAADTSDTSDTSEVEVLAGAAIVSGFAAAGLATTESDSTPAQQEQAQTESVRSETPTADSSAEEDRSRNSQEMVRVSATLLEDLVNLAGESSIVRARVEQGINDFGSALEEMETTIERVREQLRRLELETETRVSSRVERANGPAYEDFDPLEMDRYSQLQQLTRSLTESATDMMDLKETLRYRARESETLLLQQSRLNTELQEGLMRTRMVPFSRLMPRLRRIVRQVSRDLDKQVEFQAYNAEGELDRNVLERMVPPLEHMLRNAIDHGIESQELRHSFGKPSIGHISLKLSREGGDVVLEITDDGAGIDVESVRAKAVERGLMAADAALSDEQVLGFVLAPGFTTAKSLTQISGRGVGMDVVHSEVKQLGGNISISSTPGRGTTFTVRLPFTVSVNRALMVTLGEDQYAIPLNTIEGIVLLSSDDLTRHYGPQGQAFEYAGVPYRVRYLGGYLGREYVARPEQVSVPLVLIRSGDQAVAVHVDDVQGSREIVVKSLGPQFAGVGGISGATILGDGSVVIILDLLSLMRTRGAGFIDQTKAPSAAEEERSVLVVDDSVTVRKVTSRLLERQGMNVMTAKDGVEAVSVLQERKPDIVLLDIEMPRMDGFEVARQVRRDERLADLPIVMISSRTGEKHRERARELGVNHFLGKPFQENELLEVIDELVKQS